MGANSYEPREAISPCEQSEEMHERLPFSFLKRTQHRSEEGISEVLKLARGKGARPGVQRVYALLGYNLSMTMATN